MPKVVTGGIVAVHAHPDDESITMGATLARYAAAGAPVTLVTATLGEQGETMYGALDGLTAAAADQLGGYRYAELGAACRALGVTDRRMLGGLGAFRDSGMAGTDSARHPRAFVHAQRGGARHGEAVDALAAILAEVRPAAVLTYDATGGYGHPDHIAAHQVTVDAVERCRQAGRVHERARLLEVVHPRGAVTRGLDALLSTPVPTRYRRPELADLGTLIDDRRADIAVAAGPYAAARRAAMRAHATQLDVWAAGAIDAFALTNLYAQPLLPAEYFRLLAGPPLPPGARELLGDLPGPGIAIP